MRDIKEGTLVIVLEHEKLKEPCFGIVVKVLQNYFLIVATKKEELLIHDIGIFPLFRTETKDPKEIDLLQVITWVFQSLPQKEATENLPENYLVITLPKDKKPSKPCWGLIKRKCSNKKYDVRTGFRKSIYVFPNQLIPVIQTNGSIRDPAAVAKKNMSRIMLKLVLLVLLSKNVRSATVIQKAIESLKA